jgi:hypothetical protein
MITIPVLDVDTIILKDGVSISMYLIDAGKTVKYTDTPILYSTKNRADVKKKSC